MFKQPSVNQIASAYQGNPAPLAQKVQQDKQQNGGIPQDLRQLLALNDITEGRNAVASQQALQAPAQMPTVAQSLQERARQAIQAQMMQQMQQQQAKQGQPGVVPPNTPQPPMQAQGIDNLPTNVGEQYAEGGIIGFSTGNKVKDTEEEKKARQREEDRRALLEPLAAAGDIFQLPLAAGYNLVADTGSGIESFLNRVGSALTGENINTQNDKQIGGKFRFSPTPFTDMLRKPEKPPSAAPVSEAAAPDQSVLPYGQTKVNLSNVLASENKPKPQPPRVNKDVAPSNVDNAPLPGGLTDLASLQSTGVGNKYLQDQLAKNQKFNPEEFKQKFLKEVGAKDLSIYDETAAELKARKERLNAPKEGYDSLMEYLGQIAQGGGGRNWMEAGARGAAGVNALRKQRLSEQDALMDKILDLGAKKKEAQYSEKLGMFNLTKTEQDRIIKDSTEIAGKLGLSEDKQRELAQNMAIEKMREKVEYDKMKNQRVVANIGAQDRDQLMNRAKALMAVDKTLTLEEAMKRAALAAGAASLESTNVRQNKDYIAAKDKIDARFQNLISDTPYGKGQKKLYDDAIADLNRTFGVTSGIDTLPTSGKTTGGVKFLGYEK